ncbi:MAG TPA: L-rhamnose catabolism isomerase [Pyrinomonadaceae bacterium]|jgi:L-rhamnose isomerase/sugar isomerase|nr:L-rhamnose catabolism isomerase [Pyrinomonadaceae bacterium]
MAINFEIDDGLIAAQNKKAHDWVTEDFDHLAKKLRRQDVDIESLVNRAQAFSVAVPSWGVGTGGTRFARFPGEGEPRDIFEKLEDCGTILKLVRSTPAVSLHIPWDRPDNAAQLVEFARARGLHFDAMNSNTFQDQPSQKLSYKFGSLTHPDKSVRQQAIDHNLECIELGKVLGSKAQTVWVGDGGNFPGQQNFRRALERYLESMREIYQAIPADWRLFIEHKFYEPAFYSTVINDWGVSYYCARELGEKAFCLVDLGHHAPNVNIEMIVARLIQFGKLAGFHFNDSKYGDDDLDSGSIKPFQLFLIFNELVDAELGGVPNFAPAYMLDQSHNVTDPIESLMMSAAELVRGYVQAHLVDRPALAEAQAKGDALLALSTLKQAFTTDVTPILAVARERAGGAIDPLGTYRASGYRRQKAKERPQKRAGAVGIV